jgi:hypothetical protein
MTPFNTGKVLIGSNFHRYQQWEPTETESTLQRGLLLRTTGPQSLVKRLFGAIWRLA